MPPKGKQERTGDVRQSIKRRLAMGGRALAAEHKQARKERNSTAQLGARLKRDPGLPDLDKWKGRLDQRIALTEGRDAERAERAKVARELKLAQKRAIQNAKAGEPLDDDKSISEYKRETPQDHANRRWYFREMNKVIDAADVIIEVLDARDPMGCRCPEIERMIISKRQAHGSNAKQIVLVLNKIDLVPPSVVASWVKFFRREYPTLAFKSATSRGGGSRLAQSAVPTDHATSDTLALTPAVGAQGLLQLLKNYARQAGMKKKKKITVGIIGYPNVGKSSLINSLKRDRAVGVSATPGFTKAIQSVRLDSDIDLVDSPGVMFSAGAKDEDLVLRNCLKVETLADPLAAAYAVCRRCDAAALSTLYKLTQPFSNPDEFLALLAMARGRIAQGGVPNLEWAARILLQDWNAGKIAFYSLPPEQAGGHGAGGQLLADASVVDAFAPELDIDAMFAETMAQLRTEKQEGPDLKDMVRVAGMEPGLTDYASYVDEDDDEKRAPSVASSSSSSSSISSRANSRRGSLASILLGASQAAAEVPVPAGNGVMHAPAALAAAAMAPASSDSMAPPAARRPVISADEQRNKTMAKAKKASKKGAKKEAKRRASIVGSTPLLPAFAGFPTLSSSSNASVPPAFTAGRLRTTEDQSMDNTE